MFLSRVIETMLNRVKIINYICFRVIFLQINNSCFVQNYFQCFFKICFFKTCWSRICFSHFSIMKSRVRFLLNVFIVTKKIICIKENASNSIKILKLKEFIYRNEEFISIFIILMFFIFEWYFTKVKNNALKTQKN